MPQCFHYLGPFPPPPTAPSILVSGISIAHLCLCWPEDETHPSFRRSVCLRVYPTQWPEACSHFRMMDLRLTQLLLSCLMLCSGCPHDTSASQKKGSRFPTEPSLPNPIPHQSLRWICTMNPAASSYLARYYPEDRSYTLVCPLLHRSKAWVTEHPKDHRTDVTWAKSKLWSDIPDPAGLCKQVLDSVLRWVKSWHLFSRSSSLFNTGFLKRMFFNSLHHVLDDIQPLIKTLIFESECLPQSQGSVVTSSSFSKQGACWVEAGAPLLPSQGSLCACI